MDVPVVGQPPAVEQTQRAHGGHGGGHAKAHAAPQQPVGPRADTVHISDAAKLAAKRAEKEEEAAEARLRASRDGKRRQQRNPYQEFADGNDQNPKPQGS